MSIRTHYRSFVTAAAAALLLLVAVATEEAGSATNKLLTKHRATRAMERLAKIEVDTNAERWGVKTAEPAGCRRAKSHRAWICKLRITGFGDTGWINTETGEPVIDSYEYWFKYRVTGKCRRATVKIMDPWIEASRKFNVC